MFNHRHSKKPSRSNIEVLQEEILLKVGKGFSASAYSRNELFNLFCVERKGSERNTYPGETLDFAISGLLEDGKLMDYGGDFFGLPKPKEYSEEPTPPSGRL